MAHDYATNNAYLARTTSLPSTSPWTVSLWFYCIGGAGTWRALWSLTGIGGNYWIGVSDASSGNDIEIWSGGASSGTNVGSHTLNEWYWIGFVSSSTSSRTGYRSLGLGAISSGVDTANHAFTPTEMRVGNSIFNEPSESYVAAIKIWDAALTLDELMAERMQIAPVRWNNLHLWTPALGPGDTRDWGPAGRNWGFSGTILNAPGPPIPFAYNMPFLPMSGAIVVPRSLPIWIRNKHSHSRKVVYYG